MTVAVNEQSVQQTVLEAIREHQLLEGDTNRIGPADDLAAYGLDSIRFIKIVVLLEQRYHIHFESEITLLENFNTLEKISRQVLRKTEKNGLDC